MNEDDDDDDERKMRIIMIVISNIRVMYTNCYHDGHVHMLRFKFNLVSCLK